ncbi:MAG: organic solvent resistance ABC transporter ATP-binding protein [Acidobacteria bacterium RIFCSPLOWO2_12_FULL_54_10]|nr:MAG: organic solvent resistance ABC transporter ATP-binding protein [Acidobacteria bacterium RIFCSPLOWO2_12_FULL_54_10]
MSDHYIEFADVYKAFGENRVLQGVSFFVDTGETLVILGRSGVGKSVSLSHIMGFLKPDTGRVWVAGEDITDYSEKQLQELRKKVTMVFQSGALFDSLSVFENVAFSLRERGGYEESQIEEVVLGLLDLLEIREHAEALPADLSTGMKRAAAIARALAAQPQAILYDEPTTMVDPLMSQHIGDLIERLKRQLRLTSVVVTHDTRLAKKVADRLMFLEKGKVIFFGRPEEIIDCADAMVREFFQEDEIVVAPA